MTLSSEEILTENILKITKKPVSCKSASSAKNVL